MQFRGWHTFLEREPTKLALRLSEIVALSNGEKEALGFLPNSAYEDAIKQKRLMAIVASKGSEQSVVAGYILHGGVFPHARVQQVCASPEWRRRKVGSALIDALVSDLERTGFLTVKANVADNLPHAQAFYERHGFELSSIKQGGSARGRNIAVRVKTLDTPHLFSTPPDLPVFSLSKRAGAESSFYTFDLNVLFDLVKNRKRHDAACALFGAALSHRIRLGVASEFISELKRTTTGQTSDPVLQMALQLPRLAPPLDADQLDALAVKIHDLVFTQRNLAEAGSAQAKSDARHLAHSAMSRVAGFITSDSKLLEARETLLAQVGIDVASLDELLALLPEQSTTQGGIQRTGAGFQCSSPNAQDVATYLKRAGVRDTLIAEVSVSSLGGPLIWRSAISEEGEIVAVACLIPSTSTSDEERLLIHVSSGHLNRELYAEFLLNAAVEIACKTGPAAIRLFNVPGQPTVNAIAKAHGFVTTGSGHDLIKVAIGLPLTQSSWDTIRHQARRKAGLTLPAAWPQFKNGNADVPLTNYSGQGFVLSRDRLEDIFRPTLYIWPGRDGVIVPIQRSFADELLGTNAQTRLSFVQDRDASFLSRRAYVNSPRARGAMRPGLPILFYESGKKGGRGAITAVARIVDSVLISKSSTSNEVERRAVVDDLSALSAADEVLMTTFDNLMLFPKPVDLAALRTLGAVGANNLVSATPVSSDLMAAIIEAAWAK